MTMTVADGGVPRVGSETTHTKGHEAHRGGPGRYLILICLGAMLSGPVLLAAAEEAPPASQGALIRNVLPSVVNITVRREGSKAKHASDAAASATPDDKSPTDKTEYGSGFVVDASGVIVTNYHVVENAWEILVAFSDGMKVQARLMKATRLVDVALLKVDVDHPLPVVTWGDSDKLLVGDPVIAVGNPFGVGTSVTGGIVSALNRDISDSPYDDFIQTDAAINHGNSGGPLFNMQGNVIGMNTAIISPTTSSSGLGFAIPSDSTRSIIARLEAYGWLRPGWVGMKVQEVSVGMARAFGMAKAQGSIVANVTPGGPADQGGLRAGDIIMRVGDTAPTDERALLRAIAKTPIGQTVSVRVRRGDREQVLSITVAEWPRELWDVVDKPVAMPPFHSISADLGISLVAATAESSTRFGIADPRPGVLVSEVAAGSDAADRGLVPGDIIMRVMDNDVATPDEVQQGFDAARAARRDFVVVLVWPKVAVKPGPEWIALRVAAD